MKTKLIVAMMAMGSLLFLATGAYAQGCSGSYEWDPYFRSAGTEQQACIPGLAPAVPAQKQGTEELTPAGSTSHRENTTPNHAPHHHAPWEHQPYNYWQG